jgi:hypothetical protein
MPNVKTMLQVAAITLAVIAVKNKVPAIGKYLS